MQQVMVRLSSVSQGILCYRFWIIVVLKVVQIISRIEFWLIQCSIGLLCFIQVLIQCCRIWLVMKGISSCRVILLMVFSVLLVLFLVLSSSLISSGVRNMLSRFDMEVLYIVVGMLLCVSEVKVMEDCIVVGRVQRNRMLRYSFGVIIGDSVGFSVRLSSGNIMKVQVNISRCRCQWVMLVMIVWCDSLVLWRKNSRLMLMLVIYLKIMVVWLLQGRKVVRRMVVISVRVKLFGRKCGWDMGMFCRIGEYMVVFWLFGEFVLQLWVG